MIDTFQPMRAAVDHAAIPAIVRQIVGRCLVEDTNRQVIRYFISRLKRKSRTWRAMSRADRKVWMRHVIQAHAENRALYRYVMRGSR